MPPPSIAKTRLVMIAREHHYIALSFHFYLYLIHRIFWFAPHFGTARPCLDPFRCLSFGFDFDFYFCSIFFLLYFCLYIFIGEN